MVLFDFAARFGNFFGIVPQQCHQVVLVVAEISEPARVKKTGVHVAVAIDSIVGAGGGAGDDQTGGIL